MARVNIEDKLFSDQRWMKLIIKCGCRHKAIGILTGAWILAQKNWLQFGFIPEKAWDKDFDILIEVELATRRADGNVYIKGSKRAFKWLDQRVEAGRKGGLSEKRVKSSDQTEEQTTEAVAKRSLDPDKQVLSGAKPLSPTLSPTLPLSSSSNSNSLLNTSSETVEASASKKSKKKSSPEKTELNRKIWESYAQAFSERYRVQPTRNASVNAKISQLGERLGEEAIAVVKFFLSHTDGFYLKKIHDIGLCLKDAESLHVQMQRGKAITSQDVRNFERNSNQMNLVNEARKGGF